MRSGDGTPGAGGGGVGERKLGALSVLPGAATGAAERGGVRGVERAVCLAGASALWRGGAECGAGSGAGGAGGEAWRGHGEGENERRRFGFWRLYERSRKSRSARLFIDAAAMCLGGYERRKSRSARLFLDARVCFRLKLAGN